MRGLNQIRLSRRAVVLLTCVSALACALVISDALGHTPAQTAALAALRRPPVVIRVPAATTPAANDSASTGGTDSGASGDGSDAGSSAASGGGDGGDSGASDLGAGSTDTSSDTGDSGTTGTGGSGSTSTAAKLPKIGHVFEIALTTPSYKAAFGAGSAAPYLRSLKAKGTLLSGFDSLGSAELPDFLAMVSGQGPNRETNADCPSYNDFPERATANAAGVVAGQGCVYPESALTIGDQVTASGHVWKAYIADMGKTTCLHPNSEAADDVALPGAEPGYDTRHNPFIYFHSLLDLGGCSNGDVDLDSLGHDLAKRSRTPAFSFIAPGLCADTAPHTSGADDSGTSIGSSSTATTPTTSTASTTPTSTATTTTATTTATTTTTPTSTTPTTSPSTAYQCPAGEPSGIAAENAFLREWVPRILRSAAYRKDGVLVIAFATAGARDSSGPIRTGALVLSRYARKRRTISTTYSPYSLLHSVELMLGFTPLAHAAKAASFASAVLGQ